MTAARALTTPPRPDESSPDNDLTRIARVVARVPEMSGGDLKTSRLPGGLTNRNYRVTSATGRQVVVRLSSAQSALLAIDRDSEFHNAKPRPGGGVGPEVLAYEPDLGALVIDWIDGETLAAADLDDSATLALVAQTCRQLHAGPRFAATTSTCSRCSAATWTSSSPAASGFPRRTSTSCRRPPRSARRWRCATRARCPATTTCSRRTSWTTATGCGSSTTSTPATTTRASSSATSGASHTSTPAG